MPIPHDITDTPEYASGQAWADANVDRLRELYTTKELDTSELRSRLFTQAEKFYPLKPGDMMSDLRQTAWVAGALHRLTETMPLSQEGVAAIFDAALEISAIWGAEVGKAESLEKLREKPAKWWKTKFGDATPDDVLSSLAMNWMRHHGREKKRSPKNKWEILVDTLGSREMWVMATLKHITHEKDGLYQYYDVDGESQGFQVMSKDVWVRPGVLAQGEGDITG